MVGQLQGQLQDESVSGSQVHLVTQSKYIMITRSTGQLIRVGQSVSLICQSIVYKVGQKVGYMVAYLQFAV